MLKELRNNIYDNNFKIIILENKINIKAFKEILIFEDNQLLITTKQKQVKIKGENLTINKLENNELLILGKITTIELG